jgi:hypothetical protein
MVAAREAATDADHLGVELDCVETHDVWGQQPTELRRARAELEHGLVR